MIPLLNKMTFLHITLLLSNHIKHFVYTIVIVMYIHTKLKLCGHILMCTDVRKLIFS